MSDFEQSMYELNCEQFLFYREIIIVVVIVLFLLLILDIIKFIRK